MTGEPRIRPIRAAENPAGAAAAIAKQVAEALG